MAKKDLIDFGKSKKRKEVDEVGMQNGSVKDLEKQRKAKMAEFQDSINELFEDWTGAPITIVMVEEDEDAKPIGVKTLMAGAGRPESQMRMAKALDKASNKAVEILARGVAQLDLPDMLKAVGQVIEGFEERNK